MRTVVRRSSGQLLFHSLRETGDSNQNLNFHRRPFILDIHTNRVSHAVQHRRAVPGSRYEHSSRVFTL